ncbi:extensin [Streptomyces sp. NPDC059786]|uniref:extensin n=1 Tax=Streptomyces sp. NPDC059786 TaxID=3346946 RepID=UPI003647AC26
MKQIDAREAIGLLRSMTRVLCAVGLLALIFTTVNVTRFATGRNVPLPIAILLDPMIGTALAGVLYVDARLAAWGIRPPTWSTALRWGAGCTAALMNTWESLWPDGQIGWPRRADPAAVLLHLTPALLLIALTETIAAYRRTVTDLLDQIDPADPIDASSTDPLDGPAPSTVTAHRSDPQSIDRDAGAPDLHAAWLRKGGSDHASAPDDPLATTGTGRDRPHPGNDTPHKRPRATNPRPAGDSATDADVWPRAVALNDAARAATGETVSIWRLRTDLHIGPRRARRLREQLLARHPDPPPATS